MEDPFSLGELGRESRNYYRVPGFTGFPRQMGDVALDLGLNVGAFSLAYAHQFDRVVAVEASSRCIQIARENLERAGISNVEIVHRALAAVSGEEITLRRIYVGDTYESKDFSTFDVANESLEKTDFPGRFGQVEEIVGSVSWNDLLTMTGVSRISFVKCDIEGAEFSLLHQADLSMVDCLALELHYTFLGLERVLALISHLGKTHKVLGIRSSKLVGGGHWPPPSILWFINRQVSGKRFALLSTLATFRKF